VDFELDEEHQAIADLSAQILGDKITHASLSELEAQGGVLFARDAWDELARAGLLGVGLPVQQGGAGCGVLGAGLVLEAIGRTAAPLPYLASVVMGAMTLADHGRSDAHRALVDETVTGRRFLTAALVEDGAPLPPSIPSTTLTPAEAPGAWRLDGRKSFVPWLPLVARGDDAEQRGRVLVPATTPDGGLAVAIVDPGAAGATVTALDVTTGWPEGDLDLDGVEISDDDLLSDGDAIVASIVDRATAGICLCQAGVSEAALRLTATYTTERTQFGSPIATFQAVAQRAADAYIDSQAIRFTAWQAAWRLDAGLDAADALDIAKFWAAEAGSRVAEAAQHLHGGIGVDTDYPLHRFYRLAKHLELTLGGRTARLLRLGVRMADAGRS
jgi:alkylation response protein AidB-like acyl-CoA dehydrogenase